MYPRLNLSQNVIHFSLTQVTPIDNIFVEIQTYPPWKLDLAILLSKQEAHSMSSRGWLGPALSVFTVKMCQTDLLKSLGVSTGCVLCSLIIIRVYNFKLCIRTASELHLSSLAHFTMFTVFESYTRRGTNHLYSTVLNNMS